MKFADLFEEESLLKVYQSTQSSIFILNLPFNSFLLKAKCVSLLREQTAESLASPDFEDLPKSTVLSIVNDEWLGISELNMFDCVVRWAGYQCTLRDLEINGTNMRQVQFVPV